VLDGEAIVPGLDGVPDFNALHWRKHDREVRFCAFDLLVEGGDDLRKLPLSMRTSPPPADGPRRAGLQAT
jgi:bifunctional non-homologous end joining protein LigD